MGMRRGESYSVRKSKECRTQSDGGEVKHFNKPQGLTEQRESDPDLRGSNFLFQSASILDFNHSISEQRWCEW